MVSIVYQLIFVVGIDLVIVFLLLLNSLSVLENLNECEWSLVDFEVKVNMILALILG